MPIKYSPLCDTNLNAYLAYCFSNGSITVKNGGSGGTGSRVKCDSGGVDVAVAVDGFLSSVFDKRAALLADASGRCATICDGDSGYSRVRDEISGVNGIGVDIAVDLGRGGDNGSGDVHKHCSVEHSNGVEAASVMSSVHVRGPNYERNKLNRVNQRKRKAARRAAAGANHVNRASERDGVSALKCDGAVEKKGFWGSCSDVVRQELIDSKARMHIAANNKKAEEDERRVKQLLSPEQVLRDAMRMINFAHDQAKEDKDHRIYGWAKTVAESYAETIARSAPNSVESFDSFIESHSSITSVSLDAYNDLKKRHDVLESKVASFEKKKNVRERKPVLDAERVLEQQEDVGVDRSKPSIYRDSDGVVFNNSRGVYIDWDPVVGKQVVVEPGAKSSVRPRVVPGRDLTVRDESGQVVKPVGIRKVVRPALPLVGMTRFSAADFDKPIRK